MPIEVMSDTMKRIGDFLPLTYGVDLLQGGVERRHLGLDRRDRARRHRRRRRASSACACTAGADGGGRPWRHPPAQSSSNTSASRFLTAACTFLSSGSP